MSVLANCPDVEEITIDSSRKIDTGTIALKLNLQECHNVTALQANLVEFPTGWFPNLRKLKLKSTDFGGRSYIGLEALSVSHQQLEVRQNQLYCS